MAGYESEHDDVGSSAGEYISSSDVSSSEDASSGEYISSNDVSSSGDIKIQTKEMTLESIAKEGLSKGLYDEAISYLEWEIYQKEKKEIMSQTLEELSAKFELGKAYDLIQKHIIEERNEAYTPRSAFEKIAKFIPKDKIIWEPFTRGNHKYIKAPQYLRDLGFNVIATGEDFFSSNYGDIVVSNVSWKKITLVETI
jgi:hypothetical protein